MADDKREEMERLLRRQRDAFVASRPEAVFTVSMRNRTARPSKITWLDRVCSLAKLNLQMIDKRYFITVGEFRTAIAFRPHFLWQVRFIYLRETAFDKESRAIG